MEKRIFIHAVWSVGDDEFECRAPSCGFIGNLFEAIWHIIQNQFIVTTPEKKRR